MSSRSSKRTSSDPRRSGARLTATVQVGRIGRPHGVRGEVLVEALSDVPGRLAAGSSLLLAPGPTRPLPPGHPRELEIDRARPHKGRALVHFRGVDDRETIEALGGAFLEVPVERVPPPEPGTWYQFQLVGCRCLDATEGELGTVIDVVEDGGGLLLLVEGTFEGERRRLPVPFVQRFLERVDVEAGRIELDLPAGLIDACASRS